MIRSRRDNRPLALTAGLAITAAASFAFWPVTGHAQSSSNVSVNLDVLNELDPLKTQPRLLMPSTQPRTGRIVLTPPAGVDPITPQSPRVVLRPPPGAPARIAAAPSIAVPQPAAAASAPPTSVTTPPAPPPKPAEPASTLVPPPPVEPVEEPVVAAPAPAAPQAAQPSSAPVEAGPPTASEVSETDPAETADTEPQVAALPQEPAPDEPVSVVFEPEQTELPPNADSRLSALADRLIGDDSLRVQLLAYAGDTDGSPSSVRRTSLSRALSVREFLMDQGVQSTRIEVRALGDQSEGGNPDRVDAIVDQR